MLFRSLLPPHLRTLAIENITDIAINEDNSPRDRLKALELIGKFAEVSLFEDRKEALIVSNSEDMKDKLLEAIKSAMDSNSFSDAKKKSADELLRDIKGDNITDAELIDDKTKPLHDNNETATQEGEPFPEASPLSFENMTDPHTPESPILHNADSQALHSIPDTQSQSLDNDHTQSQSVDNSPLDDNDSHLEGGTPIDFVSMDQLEPIEKDPPSENGSPIDGEGVYE